jgi:hypothetical protein
MRQTPLTPLLHYKQAYLDDARLFADALAELQGQLATIEAKLERSKPPQSSVLKEVLELTDTPQFRAYVQGTLSPAPQPGLAAGIDDNVRLLGVLRTEMAGYVRRIEALQEGMKARLESIAVAAADGDGDEAWRAAADDALLSAGMVDGLKKDLVLIVSVCGLGFRCSTLSDTLPRWLQEKVTSAVSVLTPSADVSSYLTILKVQPYLSSALVEQVLAWRRGGSGLDL